VKELRLAGISTIAEANRFLEKTYLPKMNQKFSIPAAKPEDAHVPLGDINLKDIICLQYARPQKPKGGMTKGTFLLVVDTRYWRVLTEREKSLKMN
jgi:hypothetical protein